MRTVATVAITSLALACRLDGPELRHPVGETTVTAAPVRTAPPPEPAVEAGYTPPALDLYLAGQTPGPCGKDRLPSIEFEFGSSTIAAPQELQIQFLARCLTEEPFRTAKLVLVGHADPIGASTYNLALGLERATTVMDRLAELGVSPDRIVVTSAGEVELPRERWDEARRVDVLVGRGGAASPPSAPPRPVQRGIPLEGVAPPPR